MKQTVRLGRVAGIAVGAHWSVAVILVIIAELLAVAVLPGAFPRQSAALYWAVAGIAAVVFLASLLAHELAHALVARRNGVGVRSITLWMLGGMAELDTEAPSARADLRIALAGPAASLVAGLVLFGAGAAIGAAGGPGVAVAAAMWLALMNGILAVFNLLPGAPLDGGRVLRAALWRHYGDRERAERGAARAGRVLGAALIGFGIGELLAFRSFSGLWLMLIGWFLITTAAAEEKAAVAKAALAGVRVAAVMTTDPDLAPGWESVSEFIGRVAARSRQDAFPVVGPDGGLTGVVLASQLARIPAGDRARLRLDQVAVAVPPGYRAAPDDPVGPLLTRRPLGGQVAAVVLAGGHVMGLVMADDLQRALRWRTPTGARP
ncbi:MAG TPA: site-2 protease family protein [Streptosporangiaceae bacterium]|nr:site-2 protease family protein [Streptosporangiaceae bacterium]